MELLERDAPRAVIAAAFKQAGDQEGAIVLVSGEAGIGKTAFVTDFVEAQRSRARIFWGACDPLFTPRPLGPVYDIAVRSLPQLLDLLNSGADWLVTAAALHKVLLEGPSPAILVFEDIHWADEATLDLVKYIGRRVQHTKSLFILTYREDEIDSKHPLRSVLGNLPPQHTVRLPLEPLSRQAVEAIALKMNRPVEGVYESTGGNPFFVTEVLRTNNHTGVLSATVRDAVLARVAQLPSAVRDLLELASIIPGLAELWLLETILHPEPATIDTCVERGFLLPAGEALIFRHELARLAIEGSLSPGRSKDLHRKVLAILTTMPDGSAASPSTEVSLARLVHHAMRAADGQRVLEYAPQAAEQASRHGAHREAVRYYQAAIQYRHLHPADKQAGLLDGLSFEYYLTGQIDDAIQARQEAVDLWRQAAQPQRMGDDLRWLSRLYWFQGNQSMAERFAGEAIAALEHLPPDKALAMAYSNRSQLYVLANRNEEAITWGQKALELAEALAETEIVIHALTNIGTAELFNADERGRDKLERALRLARANEIHDHVARCYANLTSLAVQNRDYPSAETYLAEGLAYTMDRDMDSYSVYLLGWRARWFFEQGRWAEAAEDAEAVLRLHPGSAVIALPGITTLGYLKARQGSADASAWLDRARDLALPTGELQRIGPVALARAEAAWWNGHPEWVMAEFHLLEKAGDWTKERYLAGAVVYWTWLASGETRQDVEIPSVYRAMISGDWRSAANEWARMGCPFERALALSHGDADAQRTALTIFESLGAHPARRLLREQMTGEGLKGLPRGARAATKANPEGLTMREMDILALLGQGLSNAEIGEQLSISPKTVDHHVSAVLAKLQVHSRLEAIAMAHQKNLI